MPERRLSITFFSAFLFAVSIFSPPDVKAGGYTWIDEKGVTHFSDEKPENVSASERNEGTPVQFKDEAIKSYERQYDEICGDVSSLSLASGTLLDIYIERLASLQRDIGADNSLTQQVRNMFLERLDACAPALLSARETAQRRERYQKKSQDVLQQKMQRFEKLRALVAERLEQRRKSSMARGVEGAKFYSDLRTMGDNPLSYGMTKQDVRHVWGEPMREQQVNTKSGEMNRVSYPLGIDLYFRDGLLETWGWRR